MVFTELSSCFGRGLIKFGFRGKASSLTNYDGILMLLPIILLIGGTFKSPELNTFELLKPLLLFSHPWAPTTISVKQQFASATLRNFIE